MKVFFWITILLVIICAGYAQAHETLDTGNDAKGEIGITEMAGQALPRDITFHDEKEQMVKMGDMLGKPTILTLVYFTCDRICPQLLAGLAATLPRLSTAAGKDYRVITVSFDNEDTPQIARSFKRNYIKAAGTDFPPEAWRFLTGDRQSIQRLTEAVGFRFRKDVHGFTHPVVLIFLSGQGKIAKYFPVTKFEYGAAYPISFSSFDLNIALAEAAQGKQVTGLKRALVYCFSHEPPGQSKFYFFIGIVGLATLLVMVSFFIYLQATTKRHRLDEQHDSDK